jgi:hypothetical protein
MILFARPQRHARRQAQGIIGVSPVFPAPAKRHDRKPERHTLPAETFADFQPYPATQAGRLTKSTPCRFRNEMRIVTVVPLQSRYAPPTETNA